MKYDITTKQTLSFASITKPGHKTVTAFLSTDIHTEITAKNVAVQLIYSEALLSGAGKYTRSTFLDALNKLGADLSVTISDNILTVSIRSRAEVFSSVLKLIEVMFSKPLFAATELKRIKQTLENAIIHSQEDSKTIAHEQLRNTIYGPSDRRFVVDDKELIAALKTVTAAQLNILNKRVCHSFFTASIAADKTEIASFEKTLKAITKVQSPTVKEVLSIHQQKPPQPIVVLKNIPSRQNIDFSIGAPLPITLHHPDFLALSFALSVLGKVGGFSGRLMSTVRELEGLTYGIYADTQGFFQEEQGYWRIMTFFAPEKSLQGLTSTFREVNKLYASGITQEEFTRFKEILKTGQDLKQDSTASLLSELHSYHLQKFTLAEIKDRKKRLLNLTLEEINNAIRTYLNPATLTISGAGPINKHKKELQEFLKTVS